MNKNISFEERQYRNKVIADNIKSNIKLRKEDKTLKNIELKNMSQAKSESWTNLNNGKKEWG